MNFKKTICRRSIFIILSVLCCHTTVLVLAVDHPDIQMNGFVPDRIVHVSGNIPVTDTVLPLSSKNQHRGWEALFDGKHTDKWKGVKSDAFPSDIWIVEKGALFIKDRQKGEDIITRESYADFDLRFDFKLTDSANSGIKYFVQKVKNNSSGRVDWNGPEYQIIDDYNHPAVKNNQNPLGSTAALYLLYAPENAKLLPAGRWNKGRIVAKNNHVEHWLNGVKVVSYERGTKDYRDKISATKFRVYDRYGEVPAGHIMLTNHDGDKVYYRNIRIRRL